MTTPATAALAEWFRDPECNDDSTRCATELLEAIARGSIPGICLASERDEAIRLRDIADQEAAWAKEERASALALAKKCGEEAIYNWNLVVRIRERLSKSPYSDHGHHCESRSAVHAALQMIRDTPPSPSKEPQK